MSRGSRGMSGSKALGFHPGMVSGDTYGFDRIGMGPVDGFAMPNMFTAPVSQGRGFPPYGNEVLDLAQLQGSIRIINSLNPWKAK